MLELFKGQVSYDSLNIGRYRQGRILAAHGVLRREHLVKDAKHGILGIKLFIELLLGDHLQVVLMSRLKENVLEKAKQLQVLHCCLFTYQ